MITINAMILSAIFGQKLNRFSNKLLIIEKIYLKNYSIISYKTVMTSVINPLVICGPSGTGKSTLLNKLMDQFNDCFKFSISHTTRKPRIGEKDGKEYHFIDKQLFEKMIENNLFIEFVQFSGNYYGTSLSSLEEVQKSGRIPVLDVELDGVKSLKKLDFLRNAKYVFIKPPDFQTLERNLRSRGSESEESLQKRLQRAVEDIKEVDSNPSLFDSIIINDNLEEAYNQLKQFVQSDIDAIKKLSN